MYNKRWSILPNLTCSFRKKIRISYLYTWYLCGTDIPHSPRTCTVSVHITLIVKLSIYARNDAKITAVIAKT